MTMRPVPDIGGEADCSRHGTTIPPFNNTIQRLPRIVRRAERPSTCDAAHELKTDSGDQIQ
jgi:hypothetical protein